MIPIITPSSSPIIFWAAAAFTSRLFREVREKRGMAYSVYSHLNEYDQCPMLIGAAATKNERAGEAIGVIEEEFRRFAEDGPTEDELDKAKKFLIGSYALRFDTSTKIASQLVNLQLDGFEPSFSTSATARSPPSGSKTASAPHRGCLATASYW